MNLALKFRDQMVGDLYVVGEEFDQLFAALNARLPIGADGSLIINGNGGSVSKFKQIEVTESSHLKTLVKLDGQIEMLKGPWVFDVPNAGHIAVLRPPDPSGTYNDYNPVGVNDAIGIEIEPTGATTITGIANPTRRKRLLFLRNRDSSQSITLKDADAGSTAAYRFDFAGAAMVSGTGTHALLSASHSDTTAQTVSRGSLIYGNSTPAWDELTIGASGRLLRSNGTDVSWAQVTLTTDVTGVLPAANGGSLVQSASLSITEVQLESLNTSPLTIVAAQGTNAVIIPLLVAVEITISAAYGTSPDIRVRYNGSTTNLIPVVATGLATATGRQTWMPNNALLNFSATGAQNAAVEISLSADPTNPGTGSATMLVTLYYVVVDFA